ncbi:hypothetical protein GPB2148_1556 [marine gamma proteobacterium HTCC2148]|nr:hypothetical protein GPB2148_1556 [marine gamma proteobacterium HTCC2148]
MTLEAEALFYTAPFPAQWWLLILVCLLPSLMAIEVNKLLRKRLI